jgi:hypothetical protein
MSGVKAALIRAFGNAVRVGVQSHLQQSAQPRKKLRGCQPCEAQKNADKIMREVREARGGR